MYQDNVVVLQVSFLDFGNTSVVASNSLRELPSDLLSHPFQVGIRATPLVRMNAPCLSAPLLHTNTLIVVSGSGVPGY